MQDYANHLEAVRQLREMGAVRVTIGDLSVEFAGLPPTEDEPEGVLFGPAADKAREAEQLEEWRRLQYHSSRG